MSGQWEIVKSKKANGVSKKMTKAEKKKFIENAPKVEDLLPLSQVKTLYSTFDKSSAIKPQVKPKIKENDKKKTVPKKSQQPPQEEKRLGGPHKSLFSLWEQTSPNDLREAFEVAKARNNNVPLPTVIDIAQHLSNVEMESEGPVFSNRYVTYPLCSAPWATHECLVEMLTWAGKNTFQSIYERLLRDIVYDASRRQMALGSRIILQLISELKPRTAIHAIPESYKLKDSYQSNSNCWGLLSMLWALGQAGFIDLSVGLSVWEKAMLPLIESKNYQGFVIEYMRRLVTYHNSNSTKKSVSHKEYLNALDTIFAPRGSYFSPIPAKLVDELYQHGRVLKEIALRSFAPNDLNLFFEPVMERLKSSHSDIYKKELLSFLWDILKADHTKLHVWKNLYVSKKNNGKYLAQSASLLRLVEKDLKSSKPVLNVKEVKNVLRSFHDFNRKLQSVKPKTEGLRECTSICSNLVGVSTDIFYI